MLSKSLHLSFASDPWGTGIQEGEKWLGRKAKNAAQVCQKFITRQWKTAKERNGLREERKERRERRERSYFFFIFQTPNAAEEPPDGNVAD